MEFWSKGLGKKTIAMGLTKGESLVSEDGLCLRGIMEEPVSWEYVMLLEESDLKDFFALLAEPNLARYVHASPNRWNLYLGLLKGGVSIAVRVIGTLLKRSFGGVAPEEKLVIQLPPPSVIKKKTKRGAYKRRLDTTTIAAPKLVPRDPTDDQVHPLRVQEA